MASVLKVDTLTGVTTAGSIAVTGEGNSTTTNLQQGLIKAWASRTSATTPATTDSFNVASLVDNGVGDTFYNVSSVMSNDDGACACANQSSTSDFGLFGQWNVASQLRTYSRNSSNQDTDRAVTIMGTGDLA